MFCLLWKWAKNVLAFILLWTGIMLKRDNRFISFSRTFLTQSSGLTASSQQKKSVSDSACQKERELEDSRSVQTGNGWSWDWQDRAGVRLGRSPNYLVLKGSDGTSGDMERAVSGCWADREVKQTVKTSPQPLWSRVLITSPITLSWELRWTFRVSAATRWATDGSFVPNGCFLGPS